MESIAENLMFQQLVGHFRRSSQMLTSSLHAGFSVATLTDLTPVRANDTKKCGASLQQRYAGTVAVPWISTASNEVVG
jgi:hypothetical protein